MTRKLHEVIQLAGSDCFLSLKAFDLLMVLRVYLKIDSRTAVILAGSV